MGQLNMLRMGVVSDTHWEVEEVVLPKTAGLDVLVAAGDIMAAGSGMRVDALRSLDCPVLYVPGNHEFDGLHIPQGLARLRQEAEGSNVRVLYNEVCVHQGVRFLGTTLWTDFSLAGCGSAQEVRERVLKFGDFRHQRDDGSTLTMEEVQHEHRVALDFLIQNLQQPFDGPTVVATHFAPSRQSLAQRFEGLAANPWFINELDPALITLADVWVHGHTHTSFDYSVARGPRRCRVACNPGGFSTKITLRGQDPHVQQMLLTQYPALHFSDPLVLRENTSFVNPLVIDVGLAPKAHPMGMR